MITYKYKIYKTKKTKHLDAMLRESCFVWNHALALQKRYYSLFHKYVGIAQMRKHFAKRIKRNLLHSQTRNEILERLDISYERFFKHIAKRPPKFRKTKDFCSFVFRQGGYTLNGSTLTINRINKHFKFSLSRRYEGKIKSIIVKRTSLGEYYIFLTLDKPTVKFGKTHNGASVGIDFGLKTYMTLSNGTEIINPQFFKQNKTELKRLSRNISKCKKGSNNRERKRMELDRIFEKLCNKRTDFQWKLAHDLCRKYDQIFIEDLVLTGMSRKWGRKISDLAHANFVSILEYVATKYDVKVHKIDRFYPSSKTCTCGYVNKELKLSERQWICPECGAKHKRDLLAAKNILRRGIYELESGNKSSRRCVKKQSRLYPTILFSKE